MLREKITAFDHERIHGRVVHAHGAAAHGVPEVYQSMSHLTGFHRQTIAKGKIAILAVYGVLGPAPGESRPGGVCVSTDASALSRSFIADIFVHRHWARANEDSVAA